MSAPRYAVALRRLAPRARFETCGKTEDLRAALHAAGLPVPDCHNSSIDSEGQVRIDWLGPRRFVVSAPLAQEEIVGNALEAGFAGFASADVTCITGMVVAFEISGAAAAEVLAQGMPLDVSSVAFAPASATGTELWGVGVVVERPMADPASLRVTVERSYAGYIEGWLRTAAGLGSDLKPGVMLAQPRR
jgi:heterotetrameric sarcosine oxidase gamma subunit